MSETACWKEFILKEIEKNGSGDSIDDLVFEPKELNINAQFYPGYGDPAGKPFTAWSDNWVYFPVCYDGSEWVGSVPRNPYPGGFIGHVGGW